MSGSSKRSPADIKIAIQRPRLTVKKTADTAIESWSDPTNKHRETMPALSSLGLVVSTVVSVTVVVDILGSGFHHGFVNKHDGNFIFDRIHSSALPTL
jgi:hypothetical protein